MEVVPARWPHAAFAAAALAMSSSMNAGASPGDDAKAVAALDTEYQAAVERNDAAAMDRILAEDFVLVTGRGATFTKADLLKSAREKSTLYEQASLPLPKEP